MTYKPGLLEMNEEAMALINSYMKCAEKNQDTADITVKEYAEVRVGCTWDKTQWNYFDLIAKKESGWNHEAINPSSGACGIPQALPCSKLGTDDPYEQIDWMIGYIQDRYGTPSAAWAFHVEKNWY